MIKDGKLHNPLPEPVQGCRKEMDFPIQDISSADWNPESREEEDTASVRITAQKDDFDIAISEGDDFDL